jgi:SNF2 family DNA or RNA helicase
MEFLTRPSDERDAKSVVEDALTASANMSEIAALGDPVKVPGSIRQYQWQGVTFLSHRHSALLADEMGLGKTVQAVTALKLVLQEQGCDRALIIAPASLRLNWERELAQWEPQLAVRRLIGNAEDRAATYRLPIPVMIASYEQIRTDVAAFSSDVEFDVVVLDEAQRIKNSDSATALACRLLARKRSWALTGTPIENKIDDLLSIFDFLSPGRLRPGMTRAEIHSGMQECFLRRRKTDVLPELPPIIYQDLGLELAGAQKAAYDDVWDSRVTLVRSDGVPVPDANLLALITRLKQICNFDSFSGESVKLDALRLILASLSEADDKVIIFSQYVQTLLWLSSQLCDIPHDLYHGELSQDAREASLRRFIENRGPRLLLMSLKAGGVGLNLQAAATVVLFDRWWNPAVEAQAIQRAHRFGRLRPLHAIRLLITDSVEERIDNVLAEKQLLFDRVVEDAPNAQIRGALRKILGLNKIDIHGQRSNEEPQTSIPGGTDGED